MLYDISQTPLPNPNAFSVQSSPARDCMEGQEIRRMQMASNAAASQSVLPRIPPSVKLPAQTGQSPEFFQPSPSEQANGSSNERWEQKASQFGPVYHNEKVGEGRHYRHDSLQNMPSDPEKANSRHTPRMSASNSPSRRQHTTVHYESDDTEDESTAEAHSVWILIYLSCIAGFLSALFSLYTVLTTIILLLLHPICFFCTERQPLSTQIRYFLLPPIAFQLNLIYSDLRINKSSPQSDSFTLVLVNVFGPVYAVWIAASAWVAAGFWAFTAIMGDPDGRDGHGGKDDGRAAVLGVRRWWERWLERAIR